MMLSATDIKYKKSLSGPESDLVNQFLSIIEQHYSDDKRKLSVFTEPFVGSGFPDIVVVRWNKNKLMKWNNERNNLKSIDLKIIHHMTINSEYHSMQSLKSELGYSDKKLLDSIKRMKKARVIKEENNGHFKVVNKNELFFLQSIIAIEAKVKNWKKAFMQAEVNQWFSSESYVLLPEEIITDVIIEYADSSPVGLISFGIEGIKILKKTEKRKMPVSFCSWIFNENIGRSLWVENEELYGSV